MPKLSVIIPVYNTEQYLRHCVESVLLQSFTDFELILVDNHSTDGSYNILTEYAQKDLRVNLIKTNVHGKATATRQFGLEQATGEFITYVDSDDSIEQGMYEHLFDEQIKHDADIVVCNYNMVYPNKVDTSYSNMKDEVIDVKKDGYENYFTGFFCMPRPNNYLWSRIIRRSIAAENSIVFPDVDISEDTIFTMLCTAFANRVVHVGKSYYNYYQRENSTLRETVRSRNIASSYIHAFNCVEQYVNSHGLKEEFRNIMPVYAATRVRSILFYMGLVGNDEDGTYDYLIPVLKNSGIPLQLQRAVDENLLDEPELNNMVSNVLEKMEENR